MPLPASSYVDSARQDERILCRGERQRGRPRSEKGGTELSTRLAFCSDRYYPSRAWETSFFNADWYLDDNPRNFIRRLAYTAPSRWFVDVLIILKLGSLPSTDT